VVCAALLSTLTLWGDHASPTKPAPPAGAHQWVYLESRLATWRCQVHMLLRAFGEPGGFYLSSGPRPCAGEPATSVTDEVWNRYDGKRQGVGNSDDDGVHEWSGPGANYLAPRAADTVVADLPMTPATRCG